MQVSFINCSRCGEAHQGLVAVPFVRPFAPPECAPLVWTHWTTCPTNGDPVLILRTTDIPPGQEVYDGSWTAEQIAEREDYDKHNRELHRLGRLVGK